MVTYSWKGKIWNYIRNERAERKQQKEWNKMLDEEAINIAEGLHI